METISEESVFEARWSRFLSGKRVLPGITDPQFRIADLFSSVGGLTLGASEELAERGRAAKAMAAVDIDKSALDVYKANWRTAETINKSVREVVDSQYVSRAGSWGFGYHPEILDESLSSLSGRIDLLMAGPPCQGNSNLNNLTRLNDPRNKLYLDVAAVAVALDADYVVIENVPGVVWSKDNVVGATSELLRSSGYELEMGLLTASEFGWPQTRKRFFLVGSRKGKPIPFQQLHDEMARPPLPVTWAIEGLQASLDEADVFHAPAKLAIENTTRISAMFESDLFDMPLELRPDCHKNGTTFTSSYGRMRPEKPAPTLTTGFFTPGRGRFIHPLERRTLTAHEAARIQGFPDWYDFMSKSPGRTSLAKWIGDAVPPILGYLATKSVLGSH